MNGVRLEILTEERSMELFLKGLLPRILPSNFHLNVNCFIRPHEGKSHLINSIQKKLTSYLYYSERVYVLILIDQDSNDCHTLKSKILLQIPDNFKNVVIRIVCKELENWYLGDLDSLATVYKGFNPKSLKNKAKYRNPDSLSGSEEVQKLIRDFTKTDAALRLGGIINIDNNRSVSFRNFLSGLQKLLSI